MNYYTATDSLLLEGDDFLLLETGGHLLLEPTRGGWLAFDPFEKPDYFYNPDKVIR